MKYYYPYKVLNRYWVYDRYSNKISEVDSVTYKIFSTFDKHTFDESKAIECLKSYAEKNIIIEKIKEIKKYGKIHNMFKPMDIQKCIMPINDTELIKKYKNEIRHVVFNLTDDCNLRCKYCKFGGTYDYVKTHIKRNMSYEIINASLRFIANHYKKKETLIIAFYGGEPLLEFKKIKYIVENLNNQYKNVRYAFTTNGVLLKNEIITFLIKNNFSIKISLDGPKIAHDRNRITQNGTGSFDLIEKKINMIKKTNLNFFKKKVGFVLTIAPPYNLNEVLNFFEKNTYLNQPVIINFVDPIGTNFFDGFNMEYENKKLKDQQKELLKEYFKLKIKGIHTVRLKLLEEFFGKNLFVMDKRYIFPLEKFVSPNGACYPGLDRLFITTEGKLTMCEKVNEDLPFGDVFNGINIEYVKNIYNDYCSLIDKVCLDCWAYRICRSCFNGSIENGVLSEKRKRIDCKFKKQAAINKLHNYTRLKMVDENIFTNGTFS